MSVHQCFCLLQRLLTSPLVPSRKAWQREVLANFVFFSTIQTSATCKFALYCRAVALRPKVHKHRDDLNIFQWCWLCQGWVNKHNPGDYWPSGERCLSVASYTSLRSNCSANFWISLFSANTCFKAWLCGHSSKWWIIIKDLWPVLHLYQVSSYVWVQMRRSPQSLERVWGSLGRESFVSFLGPRLTVESSARV